MKNISKIAKGLMIIILTGSVLLFSDLKNRNREQRDKTGGSQKELAEAGRVYNLGLAYFAPEASFDQLRKGLFDGLEELGYYRENNLIVKEQHINGEISNFNSLLQTMDNSNLDVIVPTSTPGVTAACAAVKKTPVAFTYTYDPIAAGAGESLTDHLPNLTGVGSFPPVQKTFELIKTLYPDAKKIGTVYNSSEAYSRKVMEVAEEALQGSGMSLMKMSVVNSSEVIQAMQVLISKQPDAIWITGDNTAMQAFDAIAGTANKAGIPVFINDVDLIEKGALAAVGIGWYATGHYSAKIVAKVMNGADPATMPIENFVTEKIVFNPKMVEKYGITIPKQYTLSAPRITIPEEGFRFAMAHYVDSPNSDDVQEGYIDALTDLGLVRDKDYTLKIFNAQGDVSTLNSIGESIKTGHFDMVFTSSTPTIQVMSKKITDCPVVFSSVADPIAAGIAESEAEHKENITGISTMSDFDGMIALVKELLPDANTVGTVFTPAEVNSVSYANHLDEACRKGGLSLIKMPANNATEVKDAAATLCSKRVDALCQISDNLTATSFASIILTTEKSDIPVFTFVSKQVEHGAVASLARDFHQAGYEAGILGGRILSGEDPNEIPWGYVSKTTIHINKDHAARYNITIPEKFEKYIQGREDQKKPKEIAFVHLMASSDCLDTEKGFREGLTSNGWKEHTDYNIKVFNAQCDIATVVSISETIKSTGYDLIVSNVAPAAQTLAQQIHTIPQIFTIVADPVGSGLGKSYTDHLPYVTGIDGLSDIDGNLDLIQKCIPGVKAIGTLVYSGDTGPLKNFERMKKSCDKRGLRLETITVSSQSEVADAINALCQKKIDVVLQIPDNVTISAFSSIKKSTLKNHIPLFCFITNQIKTGAIAGVTGDYIQQGRDAADIAIQIFDGTDPATIPFQGLEKTQLVINKKHAAEYHITIPDEVLNSADIIFNE